MCGCGVSGETTKLPSIRRSNAEADLLSGKAVQEAPALPPELSLFRRVVAAARSFWSLFSTACSSTHHVPEQ
eukprot:2756102-Amphidinium_carterae.1